MSDSLLFSAIEALRKRALSEGGFGNSGHSNYRTDATAWAILALIAGGNDKELINLGRSRLAAGQLPDGRICLSSDHPEVYWPTPLAILTWWQSPSHQANLSRAVNFLLTNAGLTFEPAQKGPDEHDHSLHGWPWVTATYSWIDPTALGVIALKVAGRGDHPRVLEAERLILDRQCLHGGWNYGNRLMYGAELRPMPENTGLALDALQGLVAKASLEPSLKYLKAAISTLRTPIALTFGLLGLGAWGERPAAAHSWLSECWQRQERYGVYDTTAISLIILASCLSGGLESLFGQDNDITRG